MREILFRAKSVKNDGNKGKWLYSETIRLKENSEGEPLLMVSTDGFECKCDLETLGQYTGLTDKNGVKIFEGDIIRRGYNDGYRENGKVFWSDNCCCYEVDWDNHNPTLFQKDYIEVIGNIWDKAKE